METRASGIYVAIMNHDIVSLYSYPLCYFYSFFNIIKGWRIFILHFLSIYSNKSNVRLIFRSISRKLGLACQGCLIKKLGRNFENLDCVMDKLNINVICQSMHTPYGEICDFLKVKFCMTDHLQCYTLHDHTAFLGATSLIHDIQQ